MTLPNGITADVTHGAIPVFQRSLGSWRLRLEREPLGRSAITRRYDRAAALWQGRIERLGMNRAYGRLMREALRGEPYVSSRSRIQALDCGIGTGAMSLALAEAMPGRVEIEGIDVSPAMLATARERLEPSGALRSLSIADIRSLPHADEQFDLVMAAHVVEHVPRPLEALAEIERVTRPGGLIVLCLTRDTPLGLFVQTKWRTHRFRARDVAPMLRDLGLIDIRRLPTGSRRFDAFSTAWAGTKPA